MLHYSCDVCKRPIDPRNDIRHVVKIEVFPAVQDCADGCCPADVLPDDADHLEEMQDVLERLLPVEFRAAIAQFGVGGLPIPNGLVPGGVPSGIVPGPGAR